MADLSAVENGLVAVLAAAVYPAAYLAGSYAASKSGTTVKLYRGWPESANLNADLKLGRAHVSVFPDPGMTRVTTRYPLEWFVPAAAVPTLTASADGAEVTFGGAGGVGQVAGVAFGPGPVQNAYAFRLSAADTPSSVAAGLAALISGASASGAILTLPTDIGTRAAVAMDTTAMRETRRQEQGIRVSIWAPTPAVRDALSAAADLALANMLDAYGNPTEFMPLSDGTRARVQYRGVFVNDKPSIDIVWRRDMRYSVEYATTAVEVQPLMLFGQANVSQQLAA